MFFGSKSVREGGRGWWGAGVGQGWVGDGAHWVKICFLIFLEFFFMFLAQNLLFNLFPILMG